VKNIHKFNAMIALYVTVLFFLLLFVLAVPLTIQRNLTITQDIIVREEIIETALLAALFNVSFFILTRFKSTRFCKVSTTIPRPEKRSKGW
jgi:uncharacterized membrane protein YciS (DUF1049 family)